MSASHTAFTGSVPENYERYLGPMLFAPYARELALRLPARNDIAVLETACGTGVVTAELRARLPEGARLVATDLNEHMLEFAQTKRPAPGIEWQVADMMTLPFADETFDYVVCQFGLMFVPDKTAAMRETRRVLKSGGKFLFSVWDELAANGISEVANNVIVAATEPEPFRFLETTPFGYADRAQMRRWLEAADFREIALDPVELDCVSPSARDAALGLVQGTPVVVALRERDHAQIASVTDAVAAALAEAYGEQPCRSVMRALIWEATR